MDLNQALGNAARISRILRFAWEYSEEGAAIEAGSKIWF